MTSGNNEIFSKAKAATVAIALINEKDDKNPFLILGTGFSIHPEGVIATCRHVIAAFTDEEEFNKLIIESHLANENLGREMKGSIPYVIFFDTTVPGQLLAYPIRANHCISKTNYDLGLIKINKHKVFSDGYPILETESYENIEEGSEIILCGFPLGNYLKEQIGTITSSFTRGIISSIIPAAQAPIENLQGFQLNIAATHGNSGGPVLMQDTGRVLGVLQGGVLANDGSILQGIAKAEPIYPFYLEDTINNILNASPEDFPGNTG